MKPDLSTLGFVFIKGGQYLTLPRGQSFFASHVHQEFGHIYASTEWGFDASTGKFIHLSRLSEHLTGLRKKKAVSANNDDTIFDVF